MTRRRIEISISGMPFGIVLTLIFVILKLCNVIDWSWVYVCLPVIISAGVLVLVFIVWAVVAIIALICAGIENRR